MQLKASNLDPRDFIKNLHKYKPVSLQLIIFMKLYKMLLTEHMFKALI